MEIALIVALGVVAVVAALFTQGAFDGAMHRWRLSRWQVVSTYPQSVQCARCGAGAFSAIRRAGKPDEPLCPECLRGPATGQLEYAISPKGKRKFDKQDLRWASRAARDYVKQENDDAT